MGLGGLEVLIGHVGVWSYRLGGRGRRGGSGQVLSAKLFVILGDEAGSALLKDTGNLGLADTCDVVSLMSVSYITAYGQRRVSHTDVVFKARLEASQHTAMNET